jgi:hypothetical protein
MDVIIKYQLSRLHPAPDLVARFLECSRKKGEKGRKGKKKRKWEVKE